MGSDRLTSKTQIERSQLGSWLAGLPSGCSVDEALGLIGSLAARIAAIRGVGQPAALPAAHHPAADSLTADLITPDVLGPTWEVLMASADRRERGSHFTPRSVAEAIVGIACDHVVDSRSSSSPVPLVWDPTCGGGAFLLAAARALDGRGHSRADIVDSMFGSDIDPVALQIADAALELWSGTGVRPKTRLADVLAGPLEGPPNGGFDLIVGNPPFLSQLASDTARSVDRRAQLLERFGPAASGYVDDAGLVLLAALAHAADRGVVALVLPQSILGAADAAALREHVSEQTDLAAIWIETGGAFDAAVDVAAPIFVKGPSSNDLIVHHGTVNTTISTANASWAAGLAQAQGVPLVNLPTTTRTVGDEAFVTAGFRQHFYGIAEAVQEASDLTQPHRLVTSGAIEPLWNRWGAAPIKFAGTRWEHPIVDLDLIEDSAVAAWFRQRTVPKLLVASQTRVLEIVPDPRGLLLPSVPVISVEPTNPELLWRLAAALSAPALSALMAASAAGTGLSAKALRIRAVDVAALPLPSNEAAWDDGARSAREAHAAAQRDDHTMRRHHLQQMANVMNIAYGCAGETTQLMTWWWERIRFPADTP